LAAPFAGERIEGYRREFREWRIEITASDLRDAEGSPDVARDR
jgi:hypothetical protein